MTSLSDSSESAGALKGWPAKSSIAHNEGVSRLEFHCVATALIPPITALDTPAVTSERAGEEEISSLREELRLEAGQRLAEIEALRSLEISEARQRWDEESEIRVRTERESVAQALSEFHRERNRYFLAVEGEIVSLALAIAAQVLQREATLDPLLLSGVVRVALEKVAGDSQVVLRVPLGSLKSWQMPGAVPKMACCQIVGDEQLKPGECVLSTSLGKVEMGVAAQLREIETGFFNLLQQRPR